MVWAQLSINRPHLVYIILGGFTSLFMLCSSVIKERLYIGEATVATICGIIFGPHAANLINPMEWGNTDQITLEFARIVLVVQCFAVGVELPKAYMERHWRSVVLLLVPVMTFGWLITSVFIWGLIPGVNWLDSLTVAACVTATDPVLASSVVGKGKFAKRVPKHLRDLLSAESGCNDGMAFPFIYLALYLLRYRPDANEVAFHWFCYTILYECVFGAFYGVCVGYIARRLVRYAHEHDIIDRESFLVFYFVLALFCAGSGSLLGMDDLLIGFACGVGFSNDGWFTEKTEESHVSNVIDLLINLAFFVYFGTIIPWDQYNADIFGLKAWRLVVIGLLVLLFRRIPIMMLLKPVIPDVKTWREALFAGHFGPIGVGAIFVAILARAELETGETTPLETLPDSTFEHDNIIALIWPVTSFLVICSILVHGSSIAVFTLGKHINTLTLTMSYTKAQEEPSWMDRLPRIQSRSRSSMSVRRPGDTDSDVEKNIPDFSSGTLPKNFLRRQREEDDPTTSPSRRRHKRGGSKNRLGGPISQSAFGPVRSPDTDGVQMKQSDSDTLAADSKEGSPLNSQEKAAQSPASDQEGEQEEEIYEEGKETVYEDREGNVLEVEEGDPDLTQEEREEHERNEARRLVSEEDVHHGISRKQDDPNVDEGDKAMDELERIGSGVKDTVEHPSHWRKNMRMASNFGGLRRRDTAPREKPTKEKPAEAKRGAARAYQFGNTIIVEDEDGEVLKKYNIPAPPKKSRPGPEAGPSEARGTRARMHRMGSYLKGARDNPAAPTAGAVAVGGEEDKDKVQDRKKKGRWTRRQDEPEDDEKLRFTIGTGGGRMKKEDFIREIQRMDPKARARFVESSQVPEAVKQEARADAREQQREIDRGQAPDVQITPASPPPGVPRMHGRGEDNEDHAAVTRVASNDDAPTGPEGLTLVDSNNQNIPFHDVTGDLHRHARGSSTGQETGAERRRREARLRAQQQPDDVDSEDDGTARVPPKTPRMRIDEGEDSAGETAAERRRREGALGISSQAAEEAGSETEVGNDEPSPSYFRPKGIRFADENAEVDSTQRPRNSRRGRSGGPGDDEETMAERRRREGALGHSRDDSDSDEHEAAVSGGAGPAGEQEQVVSPTSGLLRPTGIRFADTLSPSQTREREQRESVNSAPAASSQREGQRRSKSWFKRAS